MFFHGGGQSGQERVHTRRVRGAEAGGEVQPRDCQAQAEEVQEEAEEEGQVQPAEGEEGNTDTRHCSRSDL